MHQALKALKNKKLFFVSWRAEDTKDSPYQNWYLPLRAFFKTTVTFDTAKQYFRLGKKEMNRLFLETLKREQPDYVFFHLLYDEFELETLAAVKKIVPHCTTLNLFSDDDSRYEDWTRYYISFFDYPIVGRAKEKIIKPHTKDGINNIIISHETNCEQFKPLPLPKRYDVGLYGRANTSRAAFLEYLMNKGVNVNVWGEGWAKYPALQKAYRGFLEANDLAKVINQTKINLCFTMGGYGVPNFKGRVLEIGACNAFMLLEYYKGYFEFLSEGKDIVMFKNKEDLVKKIKYYLKNEKEREKIALALYQKIIRDHNQQHMLENMFIRIEKERFERTLPKISAKIITLSRKDLDLSDEEIKKKVRGYSFITFQGKATSISEFRKEIQTYSLEKSKKEISCCDYYVSSRNLNNYLLFKSKVAHYLLDKEKFDQCIDPSQIMVTSSFFSKQSTAILDQVRKDSFRFITKKNTVFVSIPLVTLPTITSLDSKTMLKGFVQMKFIDKLYSLWYTKKIFVSTYLLFLFREALSSKKFIVDVFKENLMSKDKLKKGLSIA